MKTSQPYLPAELAELSPDADTAPFWEGCRRRELRCQRCRSCGRFRSPPLAGCPACGSRDVDWQTVSGRGRVFSFTIVRHPVVPSLAASVPYNVILVELDDAPGAHLIGNLVDALPEDIVVGLPVEVVWEEVSPEVTLPRFRRIENSPLPIAERPARSAG